MAAGARTLSLIVNADDLGADPARDEGIARAVDAGRVTAASLLTCPPAPAAAPDTPPGPGDVDLPAVGVHLNLTEGRSLTGPIPGLAPDGAFLGKTDGRRCLASRAFDRTRAREECAAQVARARDLGWTVDHLDGHQHWQVFAPDLFAEAAVAEDVRRVRVPGEPAGSGDAELDDERRDECTDLRILALNAGDVFRRNGLGRPDHFRGIAHCLDPSPASMERLLAGLTGLAGVAEWMVHPGCAAEGGETVPFSNAARALELDLLTGDLFGAWLEEADVQLAGWDAVAPA